MKKHYEHDIFDDQKSPGFSALNDVLALATVLSIVAIVLETVESLRGYHMWFRAIEYSTATLFTIEYFGRLWLAKSKLKYAISFFGIADLIAIVPTFAGVGNLTFLKSVRSLRILRLLRILRIARLAKKVHVTDSSNSIYTINVEIYLIALISAVLFLGGFLYIFEANTTYASDIPAGMFWALKVILGGVFYQQPETTMGMIILISGRIVSLVLFGLLISLMGTVLRKLLTGSETDK